MQTEMRVVGLDRFQLRPVAVRANVINFPGVLLRQVG